MNYYADAFCNYCGFPSAWLPAINHILNRVVTGLSMNMRYKVLVVIFRFGVCIVLMITSRK